MYAIHDKIYNNRGEILLKVKRANGSYLVQLAYDQPWVIDARHEITFRTPMTEFQPCQVAVVGSHNFYQIVTRKRLPIMRIFWLGRRRGGAWHIKPLRERIYIYREGTYLYLRPSV